MKSDLFGRLVENWKMQVAKYSRKKSLEKLKSNF